MMKCKWSMDRQIVGSLALCSALPCLGLCSALSVCLSCSRLVSEVSVVATYNENTAPSSHLERASPHLSWLSFIIRCLCLPPCCELPTKGDDDDSGYKKKFMLACTFIASLVKPLVAATLTTTAVVVTGESPSTHPVQCRAVSASNNTVIIIIIRPHHLLINTTISSSLERIHHCMHRPGRQSGATCNVLHFVRLVLPAFLLVPQPPTATTAWHNDNETFTHDDDVFCSSVLLLVLKWPAIFN